MKLWMKYLIGAGLGFICAFVFRFDSSVSIDFLEFIAELFIRIGRYAVVPLMMTTASISLFKLIQSKLILRTAFWTTIITVSSSLLLAFVGLFVALIVKLPRIPIAGNRNAESVTLGIPDALRAIFPYSSLSTFANGTFLFASFFFALCIGVAFAHDEKTFRPIINLCDSLSVLFYTITKVITEVLSIGMIAISCLWILNVREYFFVGTFMPLFVTLLVLLVVVGAGIYPLTAYLLCGERHPYKILYASIAPLLVALFSGDANLILPIVLRHANESLGVHRRINGIATPLFSIFARGGTGIVIAISFIVIRRSYSDLSIQFMDVVWLLAMSFVFSFTLGAIPAGGTFTALSVLCIMYGRGFETGYLLLRPVAFMLSSFAAAFNVLTSMFGIYIVGVKTHRVMHHTIGHFI